MIDACPRCGEHRHPALPLFCPACGKAYDKAELRSVRLNGPTGESQRVDRFWRTGDPTYLDHSVPVPATDAANRDLPRHIGDDA